MNVKNNKRRQLTIQKIESAFMAFLERQDISQIKVSTICKKAEINRSTFYANFTDVYDLADKIRQRLKDEVNRLLEKDVQWQYSEADFLRLFQHIKENQTLYSFYFKLGYDEGDDLKMNDIFRKAPSAGGEQLEYHIIFFKSGFNAIVKKWLERGCKETPQQMRDILLREYRIQH